MGWNCSECGSKAFVTSTRNLTPKYKQLYTLCRNTECEQRELIDVQHNKTITPPHNKTPQFDLVGIINQLPIEDRQKLLDALQ